MSATRQPRSEEGTPRSDFVRVVEKYLIDASWTKQQMMAAIKVGETQFYRWARGENIPTKALVNRIAVVLARRIDDLKGQKNSSDLFNATDQIDGMLNDLLSAAGYSASMRGRSTDACWEEISKNRAWRVGYVNVPIWAESPKRYGAPPTGKAIEYAEQVGRLLGLKTEWEYFLSWGDLNLAIMERRIHAIAPFLLSLPERLFDYRFSLPCCETAFKISAVTAENQSVGINFLEDLPSKRTRLLYVKGEIGDWAAQVFGDTYQSRSYKTLDESVSEILSEEEIISVFLSDDMTCRQLEKRQEFRILDIHTLENVSLFPSFAFHIDEQKLISTVNSVINMIPKISETTDA
jgi:Bacterial extracellular solute-binding proteins, family 3